MDDRHLGQYAESTMSENAVQEGLKVLRGILYIFREGTHIRAIVQAGDWLKNTSRPLPLLFKRLHVPLQ